MTSWNRLALSSIFIFLNLLLIVLGLASLGVAAWQWAAVISDDVTLSEIVAAHARYSRVLLALFLMFAGCLVLVGSVGVIAGALLMANRLKVTAVAFLVVFLTASFVLGTTYGIVATLFWSDSTRVAPLVLGELLTRLQGSAYTDNSFQFRSYWDQWQLEHGCCGISNSTDFQSSLAATNANNSLHWLPNSCCWNHTLPQGACHRSEPSYLPVPCGQSLQAAISGIYWSQLGVVIAIWATYFCLVPVTMSLWGLLWVPIAIPKQH